ncbi:hypothetical protein VTO42DRAFT_4940 [Malbranchea cinnamomea]
MTSSPSLFGPLLWLLGLLWITLPVSGYASLSNETLRALPRPGDDFNIHNGTVLAPILRTRVPGTPGSLAVLEHFVRFFKTNLPEWKIEFQNSTSKTPVTGDRDVPFVNFIASRDPPWANEGDVGRVTFVAHYDSKLTPEGFIGATDSAAPCAIIMHAMRSIDAALSKKWAEAQDDPAHDIFLDEQQGIQVFFLDGEEAFSRWSATDSLYGARALAASMEAEVYPAMSTFKSPLSAISLFVLLDLLGAKHPNIPSFYKTTHWAYENLAKLESRLRNLGQFKSPPPPKQRGKGDALWFSEASKDPDDFHPTGIEDDHIPFKARGVDILHVIPSPFPRVWHTLNDNAENLDLDTVEDWSTLITAFAAEWLELEGYFDTSETKRRAPELEDSRKTELS